MYVRVIAMYTGMNIIEISTRNYCDCQHYYCILYLKIIEKNLSTWHLFLSVKYFVENI
jgi:hypothetical protein